MAAAEEDVREIIENQQRAGLEVGYPEGSSAPTETAQRRRQRQWQNWNHDEDPEELTTLRRALQKAFQEDRLFETEENRTYFPWLAAYLKPQDDWEALPDGAPIRFESRISPDDTTVIEGHYTITHNEAQDLIEFTDADEQFQARDAFKMAMLASLNPAMRNAPIKLRGNEQERALLYFACEKLGLETAPETRPDEDLLNQYRPAWDGYLASDEAPVADESFARGDALTYGVPQEEPEIAEEPDDTPQEPDVPEREDVDISDLATIGDEPEPEPEPEPKTDIVTEEEPDGVPKAFSDDPYAENDLHINISDDDVPDAVTQNGWEEEDLEIDTKDEAPEIETLRPEESAAKSTEPANTPDIIDADFKELPKDSDLPPLYKIRLLDTPLPPTAEIFLAKSDVTPETYRAIESKILAELSQHEPYLAIQPKLLQKLDENLSEDQAKAIAHLINTYGTWPERLPTASANDSDTTIYLPHTDENGDIIPPAKDKSGADNDETIEDLLGEDLVPPDFDPDKDYEKELNEALDLTNEPNKPNNEPKEAPPVNTQEASASFQSASPPSSSQPAKTRPEERKVRQDVYDDVVSSLATRPAGSQLTVKELVRTYADKGVGTGIAEAILETLAKDGLLEQKEPEPGHKLNYVVAPDAAAKEAPERPSEPEGDDFANAFETANETKEINEDAIPLLDDLIKKGTSPFDTVQSFLRIKDNTTTEEFNALCKDNGMNAEQTKELLDSFKNAGVLKKSITKRLSINHGKLDTYNMSAP